MRTIIRPGPVAPTTVAGAQNNKPGEDPGKLGYRKADEAGKRSRRGSSMEFDPDASLKM